MLYKLNNVSLNTTQYTSNRSYESRPYHNLHAVIHQGMFTTLIRHGERETVPAIRKQERG